MLRAIAVRHRSTDVDGAPAVSLGSVVLTHDERHLRRRALTLASGDKILLDLPEPVVLTSGSQLLLENGTVVDVEAAEEALYSVTARDPIHLTELAWHIGNRHLAAAISAARILIARDHVTKAMLEGLGATVSEITASFNPVRGAYSGGANKGRPHEHGHEHSHGHGHDDSHRHEHDHS